MSRTKIACLLPLASFLFFATGDASAAGRSAFDELADTQALSTVAPLPYRQVCSESSIPGFAHCFAKIVTADDGTVTPSITPQGFGAQDIQSAYVLPTSGGDGKLIAAVDAYDYPNAEADLAVYRAQYNLPACTTANGCFKKVDQNGGTNLPGQDPAGGCTKGWSGETSLDLQMLSATCPDCHILLVEATLPNQDLQTAVNTAAKLGAVAISNSYGALESANGGDKKSEPNYTHPGILVTASAGDDGFGADYPATSAGVVAVGGTTLKKSTSTRGWAESAWKGTGSGCSAEIPKPSWQNDPSCANRMEADVSAVANPSTGVAVYCTDPGGAGGWGVVGGTSVAAPLIAGAFTVLGVPTTPSFPWMNPSLFFDVTTGTNGTCATPYFCTAEAGYDGPTGWGTPNGALLRDKSAGSGADAGVDAGEEKDASTGMMDGGSMMDATTGGEDGAGGVASSSGGGSVGGGSSGGGATVSEDGGFFLPVSPSEDAGGGGIYAGGSGSSGASNNGTSGGASDSGLNGSSGGCAASGRGHAGDGLVFGIGLALAMGIRRRRARR